MFLWKLISGWYVVCIIQKTVLNTLANLCKYTVELTETVIESDTIPIVLMHVGHPNDEIKRAAAMVIKEIVRHNEQVNVNDLYLLLKIWHVLFNEDYFLEVKEYLRQSENNIKRRLSQVKWCFY